jgi:hypothetical protein
VLRLEISHYDGVETVEFEHSLLSLSKWESKHKKPYLTETPKTPGEMIDYFQAMIVSPDVDENIVYALDPDQMELLTEYLGESHTASSVPTRDGRPSREVVTSELVYYWMVELGIPFEAERWSFTRLMMLIQIVNFKRNPPKKQSSAAIQQDWAAINAQRLAKYNTTG